MVTDTGLVLYTLFFFFFHPMKITYFQKNFSKNFLYRFFFYFHSFDEMASIFKHIEKSDIGYFVLKKSYLSLTNDQENLDNSEQRKMKY